MLLKLQNIGKIYNSNDILTIGIRNINLEFDYNEFVTISGPSGAGKSTLLNVLAANDTYEEGELFFNGEGTKHYSNEDWEKYREENIAMIFQDFNIIENLTVLENVELALLRLDDKRQRRKIAVDLIDKVGLSKQINQKTSKLSGGEKQRTVIARALAKDSPIILADEPTGNLDVKSSRDIAKLLKEVSKDKLVIVVTHNPEFFVEYETRHITVFDGSIKEDRIISNPEKKDIKIKRRTTTKLLNLKNTMKIGFLNYKSRPKFTTLMTLALVIISIALFAVLSLFNSYLISPLTTSLDSVGIDGKVILSNVNNKMTESELDDICFETKAGYFMLERSLSEFDISINKRSGMLQSYTIKCIFDPYHNKVYGNDGVLIIPSAYSSDSDNIKEIITGGCSEIGDIDVKTDSSATDLRLYLSYENMENNGNLIKSINTRMKIDGNESTIYTFQKNSSLQEGEVNLVNSSYYNVKNKKAIFDICSSKMFTIVDDTKTSKITSGIIVEMNVNDYEDIFEISSDTNQSCLYFENDEIAKKAIKLLPDGYIGMLSNSNVYVQNVGSVFAYDLLWYACLVAISLLLAAILYVIFARSIKIYLADFAIYKTLGIQNNVSKNSLYVQMLLIFIPTLILLPIISLIAAKIPSLAIPFISIGNYLFIELMVFFIVEFVGFRFNQNISSRTISQVLRRGTK